MPSFGASQSVSGPSGLNSGRHSKMRMAVDGVAEGPAVGKWTGPRHGGRPTPRGTAAKGTGPIGPRVSGPFFNSQAQRFRRLWVVSGITRDKDGVALGSCTVHLFQTQGDLELAETISDAVGAFSFSLSGNANPCYLVAYLAGSPDVVGSSVTTLIPVLT